MLADEVARTTKLQEMRLYTHELMSENILYHTLRGYVETERRKENGFSRVLFHKPLS